MTKETWAKLNLPESHLRRIKSNAALAGMSMVKYVAGLVENDEKYRGRLPQQTPGNLPAKQEAK